MNEVTIEVLHNYYEMAKNLSSNDKIKLKEMLHITESDEKRLIGLMNETEFIIMIYSLGWVKSISAIDENSAQLTKTPTTDLFVETNVGKKMAIEIKSSQKREIKFTRKLVENKISYSQAHSHECYFAIKLTGYWMLFSGNYILKRNCKISLEKDFFKSEINNIFGERLFFFPKGLEIITNYSKSKKGICISSKEYGNISRIAIKSNNKRHFLITENNSEYLFMSIVLESLENIMSNQYQTIHHENDDKTIIVERLTKDSYMFLSSILMAPILHTINPLFAENFTLQTYMEKLKKEHHNLLNRNLVLNALSLFGDEYKILMSLDNKELSWINDFIREKSL